MPGKARSTAAEPMRMGYKTCEGLKKFNTSPTLINKNYLSKTKVH